MSASFDGTLLGRIDSPAALRSLPAAALPTLAEDIRACLIDTLSRHGGHFAASLGVVELTLALHRVFDTPHDRLIWDIGHQAHVHKLLTGRREQLASQRQFGGLAPFLSRSESPYDAFGAGHAGTALSAAAGMAAAARLRGDTRRIVAIVGDGGLTAGMSFEALNHIGGAGLDVLVVLNDNDMSISENVGALRESSARELAAQHPESPHARRGHRHSHHHDHHHGEPPLPEAGLSAWFQTLGFHYTGPIDGHNLDALHRHLANLRQHTGPRILHLITRKGRGHGPAEADPIRYHGINPRATAPNSGSERSYTQVFSDWLCATAARDPRLVAITPAMREGSGLIDFAQRYPERYFDVGIAEQHALTLAAGMACEGLRPVVAIYSTFLQRAYDSLIHDIALQNLPVLLAIDRGGLVGGDGATHHGAFDLSFLRCIPNLRIAAAADAEDCQQLLDEAWQSGAPAAVRYPRGPAPSRANTVAMPGKARLMRRAAHTGKSSTRKSTTPPPRLALLSFGALLDTAQQVAESLNASLVDFRYIKPLDHAAVLALAREHEILVTLEDNVVAGGAGEAVNQVLAEHGQKNALLNLGLPDRFIEHGTRAELLADCALDPVQLIERILTFCQKA